MAKYFTTKELECKCGCGFGRSWNDFDSRLIDTLDTIRAISGKPVFITSGARCPAHNKAVGGSKNSAHLPDPVHGQCHAADIQVLSSRQRRELVDIALDIDVQRMGIARDFLHVDTADYLPQSVIWTYN